MATPHWISPYFCAYNQLISSPRLESYLLSSAIARCEIHFSLFFFFRLQGGDDPSRLSARPLPHRRGEVTIGHNKHSTQPGTRNQTEMVGNGEEGGGRRETGKESGRRRRGEVREKERKDMNKGNILCSITFTWKRKFRNKRNKRKIKRKRSESESNGYWIRRWSISSLFMII